MESPSGLPFMKNARRQVFGSFPLDDRVLLTARTVAERKGGSTEIGQIKLVAGEDLSGSDLEEIKCCTGSPERPQTFKR